MDTLQGATSEAARSLDDSAAFRKLRAQSNLTPSQLLIWLAQQLKPDSPMYNMPVAIWLPPNVEAARFIKACTAALRCHTGLRYCIAEQDGVPIGRLCDPEDIAVEELDLSELSRTALQDWLRERGSQVFDYARPLIDSALLHVGADGESRLVWFLNQHHLITDAASIANLVKDVSARYAGEEVVPVDYWRYAQALPAVSSQADDDRAFWRSLCPDPLPPLKLFGKDQHPKQPNSVRRMVRLSAAESARFACAIDMPAVRALTPSLARNNLLLATYACVLHRLSGRTSISIGTPLANRVTRAERQMVGTFVEMYPNVYEVAADTTVSALLVQVSARTKDVLLRAGPGRSSAAPRDAFQFVLNPISAAYAQFDGAPLHTDWIHTGASNPNQLLGVQAHDLDGTGGLTLLFDFNEEAFAPLEQNRLATLFRHVLSQLVETLLDGTEGQRALSELALIGEDDLEVLHEFEGGFAPAAEDEGPFIEALRRVARRHPDRCALREGVRTLSYFELFESVRRVAAKLVGDGVGPNDAVAVHTPRSVEYVVGVLATLSVGAAFVPVDIHLPPDRLATTLQSSGARQVLTKDSIAEAMKSEPADSGLPEARSGKAYVIFTSGSTGQPRGVEVSDGALQAYVRWASRTYAHDQPANMPLCTSIGFDLTMTALFVPLFTGGTVLVYPEREPAHDMAFVDAVQDPDAQIVKLTPSHLRALGEVPETSNGLHTLIVGGENLPAAVAQKVLTQFAQPVRLFNEYGPTEATVGCTVHRFEEGATDASVPIGKPAEHMHVRVLDRQRHRVPIGVAGELFIAGPGLADGYLGDPDATSARFVTLPDGERAYASGDRASWQEDGTLRYHGRIDRQIKVAGIRTELAEIEALLVRQGSVQAAAVLARTVGHNVRLCAFVQAAGGVDDRASGWLSGLRAELGAHLAQAVVPEIVRVDRLPLTANGKLDEAQLERLLPDAAPVPVKPPSGAREAMLAEIWTSVLEADVVSVDADFFDLGGDSVAAIQLALACQNVGLSLTPRQVFEHPTIAALAKLAVPTTPLDDGPRTPAQPFVHSGLPADQVEALLGRLNS